MKELLIGLLLKLAFGILYLAAGMLLQYGWLLLARAWAWTRRKR